MLRDVIPKEIGIYAISKENLPDPWNIGPQICKDCGKDFFSNKTLNIHKKLKHNNTCKICDIFGGKHKKHQLIHTGRKPKQDKKKNQNRNYQ